MGSLLSQMNTWGGIFPSVNLLRAYGLCVLMPPHTVRPTFQPKGLWTKTTALTKAELGVKSHLFSLSLA